MNAQIWRNNYSTLLSANITNSATSMTVTTGTGQAVLGTLSGGDYYRLTIENSGNNEIVEVTAIVNDTLTIVRAKEGTTAQAWNTGASVEIRITKESLENLVVDNDTRLTNSRNPSGPAGGSLQGTYPSPLLTNTGVVANTYNNPTITVLSDGRISAAASVAYPAITLRVPHSFHVEGQISVPVGQTDFIVPFYVSLPLGQTAVLSGCKYKLNDGGSVTLDVQINGSLAHVAYDNLNVTTTTGSTFQNVTLSDGNIIGIVVSAVNNTPNNARNMTFTVFIDYTRTV